LIIHHLGQVIWCWDSLMNTILGSNVSCCFHPKTWWCQLIQLAGINDMYNLI
jgi:hypothetical protein